MKNTKTVFAPITIDEPISGKKIYAYVQESKIHIGTSPELTSEKPIFIIEAQDFTINVPHAVMYKEAHLSRWLLLSEWDPYHGYDIFSIPTRMAQTKIITGAYAKNDIRELYPPIKTDYGQVGIWHGLPIPNINYSHLPLELCAPIFAEFALRKEKSSGKPISTLLSPYDVATHNYPTGTTTFFRIKRGPLKTILWEHTRLQGIYEYACAALNGLLEETSTRVKLMDSVNQTQMELDKRADGFKHFSKDEALKEPLLWKNKE